MGIVSSHLNNYSSKLQPHLKLIPKMIDSHMFLHVQVIGIVPDPGQIAPDEIPVLIPGR